MRQRALRMLGAAALCLLVPIAASAQTSTIAGEVKDTSGAVLPGVTVEVASPALIEQVRSATTDGNGKYAVVQLRPGTYTVTFTLPGFNVTKRENIELTSDFTSTINAEMKVGALEETITVAAESPIVDVQSITQRTVMTRDVLDAMPTGRNIQAVGIMIPGTSLAPGGGGALSRDVGGSGNLQQSPLQYRGSGDTVQTIEGLRLNNLCAQGAYSGVYWNDGSFQEISYVTGADSAEMGQGGMRVNMVPRDGGNTFRGTIQGNFADGSFTSDNCGSPGVGLACASSALSGDLTYNFAGVTATNKAGNALTNVSNVAKVWDFNPSGGGPIKRDRAWFYYTFRHWGTNKSAPDSYFDLNPSPFIYEPDYNNLAIDDGHIVSNVARVNWQITGRDKISVYHDQQKKYRDHWGVAATVPPEASGIQVTPISFVNVVKWTRTQTNKLLLEGGMGIYDQEYTELYQPIVTGLSEKVWDIDAINASRVYTVSDQATGKIANAWQAPSDHFSLLRTFMGAASYVTGSHSFRFGAGVTQGNWREIIAYTGDMQPITYNAGVPVQVTLRLPVDRRNGIKADTGIFAQDRWALGRITLNLGIRYDWFIGETQASDVLASRFNAGQHFGECADGINDSRAGCVGRVQNWKDLSPRVGVAWDVFGNGRTAVKGSVARYVAGQNIAVANAANPVTVLGLTDTRAWTDRNSAGENCFATPRPSQTGCNGLPLDDNGNIQFNELGVSPTGTFGVNTSTTTTADDVLNGWGKRGYNNEFTVSAQHQLADRLSVNGGFYRRTFGNQTFTDDLRYGPEHYDGPFCITTPTNSNLPDGGNYQVCGLYDLKPSALTLNAAGTAIVARPANSLIRFSDDFGGETNMYQGFDVNIDARFRNGAFLRGGLGATSRLFDNCNLYAAGYESVATLLVASGTEAYPDGTSYCHREYAFRPDAKMSGSYTLPLDIQVAGTYQFSRGVQTGGAGPSVLATWAVTSASFAPGGTVASPQGNIPVNSTLPARTNLLGQTFTGLTLGGSKTVQLMREGLDYGDHNLHQLDVRLSKRFSIGRFRIRGDFDLYNVLNSNWPYTVTNTFSTAANATWLRPTNALQSRFFKFGGQLDF